MTQAPFREPVPEAGAPPAGAGEEALFDLDGVGVTLASSAGQVQILADVSFEAYEREIVSIVGRSGTGKTTLLRLLGGLLMPTEGTLSFAGRPLSGPPEGVITVFQDYTSALLPWRSVRKNVELPLERSHSRAERRRIADEMLELVGLGSRGQDYPWQLSGGMQQRAQIARALAVRPRALLMDEPFGALDAMTRANLQDELLRIQRETGTTIIFITHDLDEALYLSDKVFLIAGSSPGSVVSRFEVALPADRHQTVTRELPEYLTLRHEIANALGGTH